MEILKKFLLWLLIIIPVGIVYKNFLDFSNPLVWGDAPFFYFENLKELFNLPFVWDIRNSNFGNSQASILWLFIPTFLMGLLHYLFNFNHEIAVRVIFYFPFLIFSVTGILLIFKKLEFSNLSKIFGLLFYLLNTYILVVIDGGQIGVALSYGLFPLVFFTFLNFLDKNSPKNFLITLTCHFLIFNSDLRIALILVFFEISWITIFNFQNLKKNSLKILAVYLMIILLSGFWVIPFVSGLSENNPSLGLSLNESNFIKLSHTFYLFQPHFPNNDFGNLNKTPVYFLFLPFIFFLGFLLNSKSKKVRILIGLYLFFVFLAKGSSPPFGEVYEFLISNIPLGSAFRDSSKFDIPALLTGSLLIALSVESIKERIGKFKYLWLGLIYIFLLICIYPALLGDLTGVLGKSSDQKEFQEIHNLIISKDGDFRTLWFGEKPSLGFADWQHPSLAANLLFKEHPFASMIKGEYDKFYFLHNENISKWYELLGIKYIFYPPNSREKSLTPKEQVERKMFENFIYKIPGLNKINLPISFPVYETKNPQPKIFAQKKILFVTGGEEIYEKLFQLNNFALEKSALVFLESCKFNPETIFDLSPETFGLITTGDKNDLYLSFFCDDLISTSESKVKEWSINTSDKYLNWKSQLLERGVENYDYDFNKGLAYSTNAGEKLKFDLRIPENQNYYLPIRYLTATESGGLRVNFGEDEWTLKSASPNKLEWQLLGPLKLSKGNKELVITNLGGIGAVNSFGLIPQKSLDQKRLQIDERLTSLKVFNPEDSKLNDFLNSQMTPLNFRMLNPTQYEAELATSSGWLVFSERFDKNWKLTSSLNPREPLPFYSLINGFYIGDLKNEQSLELYYQPQESVKKGLTLTVLGLLLVIFVIIIYRFKSHGHFKIRFRNSKN